MMMMMVMMMMMMVMMIDDDDDRENHDSADNALIVIIKPKIIKILVIVIEDSGCNYDSDLDDDGNTLFIIPLIFVIILMIFMIKQKHMLFTRSVLQNTHNVKNYTKQNTYHHPLRNWKNYMKLLAKLCT